MIAERWVMSGKGTLRYEAELRKLGGDVARLGLPPQPRPEATMALAVAVRDELANVAADARACNAAALVTGVFDMTMGKLPPAEGGGAVACKAGCTYCCHNVVMATAPEIFLAARELRTRHDAAFAASVSGTCEALRATAGIRRNPCALLVDNLCSVYGARPTVCRKHTSFDVNACISDYEGRGGNIPIRRFDQMVFECCAVALLLGMRLWDGRQGSVHELSGALRVVLQDTHAEQKWLGGDNVFADVAGQSQLPGLDEHAAFLWGRFVGAV